MYRTATQDLQDSQAPETPTYQSSGHLHDGFAEMGYKHYRRPASYADRRELALEGYPDWLALLTEDELYTVDAELPSSGWNELDWQYFRKLVRTELTLRKQQEEQESCND